MKLNLGCGKNWKLYKGYEGLDVVDFGQKYVNNVLWFFAGGIPKIQFVNLFDEVMANHFLEHFTQEELKSIFQGVHETLKVGGIFKIVVPHKDRPEAWYLVHKTFFNEETFKMFDRVETDSYAELGKWKVKSLVTNDRMDIHCELQKI